MNGKVIRYREWHNGVPVIDSFLSTIRRNGIPDVMWLELDACVISGVM